MSHATGHSDITFVITSPFAHECSCSLVYGGLQMMPAEAAAAAAAAAADVDQDERSVDYELWLIEQLPGEVYKYRKM